jgi:hypothetical protein
MSAVDLTVDGENPQAEDLENVGSLAVAGMVFIEDHILAEADVVRTAAVDVLNNRPA